MEEALLEEREHTQDEELFAGPPPSTPTSSGAAPLALYRRYRPDTFADVIGQEHVTAPLQRALTNNRVNHAYLFSGPRGCGKTTSARILARCLNCELGPRSEPCGTCRSCRDLERGAAGSIDVIEIDAASHGGVDDARELRERAFFAPVQSRYKIYIIDEAHMVTPQGFNALLKLVEEPPPHVKFIFATTEPDKVIGTIRSRTHHYPFRLVPPKVLTDYLGKLCAAEGIAVEQTVLPLVVRAGAGSVRDSLSVLDQLLGGAEESGVSYRHATALLGYTPDSLLDEFVDAFAAGDAGGVFSCVDKVIEVGQDPRRFAEDLLRRLRDLVVVAAVPDALRSGLVEVAPDQAERLSSQAAALGAGEVTRAAEVIAAGLTDMRGTTAPRLHLELMCARVLLPGADVDERGVHARLDRIERRLGVSVPAGEAPPAQGPSSPARPAAASPAAPPSPASGAAAAEAPASPSPRSAPAGVSQDREDEPSPTSPSAEVEPPATLADAAPEDLRGPSGGDTDDTALGAPRRGPVLRSRDQWPAHRHRCPAPVARGPRGGQGQAPVHLDPAQPERSGARAAQRRDGPGHGQRRRPGQLLPRWQRGRPPRGPRGGPGSRLPDRDPGGGWARRSAAGRPARAGRPAGRGVVGRSRPVLTGRCTGPRGRAGSARAGASRLARAAAPTDPAHTAGGRRNGCRGRA